MKNPTAAAAGGALLLLLLTHSPGGGAVVRPTSGRRSRGRTLRGRRPPGLYADPRSVRLRESNPLFLRDAHEEGEGSPADAYDEGGRPQPACRK